MVRNLTQLEKYGLIAMVVIAMLFFYLREVYDPQQEALERAREQLNRTISEFNELASAAPAAQLRRRLESRQEERDRLAAELEQMAIRPAAPEELALSRHLLYSGIERNNLRLLEVTTGRTQQDLFTWHVFRVDMEGDYRGLAGLLEELREHIHPLRVEKTRVERGSSPWPLKMSMELWIMQ